MADANYDFVKAIFYRKKVAEGRSKWVRSPYNLVKRGSQTGLEGNHQVPGRGLKWDTADGEEYDEVLMLDSWPTTWPYLDYVP